MTVQPHHLAALLFALMAVPALLGAHWLSQGRIPLTGGSGMTVRDKALLDNRLARLLRMIALAMFASGLALGLWGDAERRLLGILLVMFLLLNGLSVAGILMIANAKRRSGGKR